MNASDEDMELRPRNPRRLPPAWQILLLAILFGAACAAFLRAQDLKLKKSEKANWELAENWLPNKTHERLLSTDLVPNWLPGEDRFWYRYLRADGRHYLLVDPAKRTKSPLFDREKLGEALTGATGTEVDGSKLEMENIEIEGDTLSFVFEGARWAYLVKKNRLEALPGPEEGEEVKDAAKGPETWATVAPDGAVCVYARGNDLYVCSPENPTASEKKITSDGAFGLSWGNEWELVADNDTERRPVPAAWSPDSSKFAILRADLREVGDLWLVDHLAEPRPVLKTYKCPFPGEKVARWELWVWHREGDRMVRVEAERFEDQTLDDLFVSTLWWGPDSSTLFFPRRSRDYRMVDVCAADPASGMVRTLLEERIEGMVYIREPMVLPNGEGYLWWSMRDGWGHLYRYDAAAQLRNQVTAGEWTVEEVLGVDGEQRVIYFTACGREAGRNPYYTHFYRVNYDGTGLELLTPEDAHHQVALAPGHTCFVDNCSRMDTPTRCLLRDMRGKLLRQLEAADITPLTEAGWKPPEVFRALAADGVTEMWGVMWKPFDFDSAKRYPVATRVYPGRQDEYIPLAFNPVSAEATLAQLGVIVVRFGNRGGTPKRGLAYREYGRERFRDYGLADKRAVIEQLGQRHRWIDLDRVGIYGGSSGGFMTVSAMLVDPDFWKVGVAMSAPNDPGIYFAHWVERYKGVETVECGDGPEHAKGVENAGAGAERSKDVENAAGGDGDRAENKRWEAHAEGNVELAANLEGKLLMINGAQDENVHPAHLYRMADALIKANKRFDMFIVPGAGHGLGGWRYLYGMVWDYFAEHLIGDAPRPGAEAFVPPAPPED